MLGETALQQRLQVAVMAAKYERIKKKENPFIDPKGYKEYVNLKQKAFEKTLADQKGTDK